MLATLACLTLLPTQVTGSGPLHLVAQDPPAHGAFGLRIDWGLSTLWGAPAGPQTPAIDAVVQRLPERFDPWRFDATTWVQHAQDSGAGFLVFEARDPLGFCLWDNPDGSFDAPGSAAAQDLLSALIHASDKAGMPLGLADSSPGTEPPPPYERATAGQVETKGLALPPTPDAALADLLAQRASGERPLYTLQAQTDGSLLASDALVLAGLGTWMSTHAEAVQAVSANPLRPTPGAWMTCANDPRQSTLYLALQDPRPDAEQRVQRVGNIALGARFLGDGPAVHVQEDGLDLVLSWSGAPPAGPFPVLALELKGEPIPLEAPVIETPAPEFVFRRDVRFATPSPMVEVRYTMDGSTPVATSPLAPDLLQLDTTATIHAVSFLLGVPVSEPVMQQFERVRPLPAVSLLSPRPGLYVEIWTAESDSLEQALAEPPARIVRADRFLLPGGHAPVREVRRFRGFVRIARAETYTFEVESSGALQLAVSDTPILGAQKPATTQGHVSLSPGWHAIELTWSHGEAPAALVVRTAVAGEDLVEIPSEDLAFERL